MLIFYFFLTHKKERWSLLIGLHIFYKIRVPILRKKDIAQNPLQLMVAQNRQWDISSVQFSRSVVSDSLRPHESQHARPPCPSPTPGVYSDSCLLSWWGHPTISSSVITFSSCLQSFPESGAFQMSHSSHQVAKVLEFQLQHQSFQWIFRIDFL